MSGHIEIEVREIHQTGGDCVVVFDASIELAQGRDDVEVVSVSVKAGNESLTEKAADSIKSGIRSILQPLGFGAQVRITNLVLHPVDFSGVKFQHFTEQYLKRAMSNITIE